MKSTISAFFILSLFVVSNASAQRLGPAKVVGIQVRGTFTDAATKPAAVKASSVLEPLEGEMPAQVRGSFGDVATKPIHIPNSSVLEPLEIELPRQLGGTFGEVATHPQGIKENSVLEPLDANSFAMGSAK